jgi:hypothetical protein
MHILSAPATPLDLTQLFQDNFNDLPDALKRLEQTDKLSGHYDAHISHNTYLHLTSSARLIVQFFIKNLKPFIEMANNDLRVEEKFRNLEVRDKS